jgi:hypothetical protein
MGSINHLIFVMQIQHVYLGHELTSKTVLFKLASPY